MESWLNLSVVERISYRCGHCDNIVGPSFGYLSKNRVDRIYICPTCNKPTYICATENNKIFVQVPGPIFGEYVNYLPDDVRQLYDEARKCLSINAYTSAVLASRKLLMNIAVSLGAEEGKRFADYVAFLEENNWIPPNGKEWVDHIRKVGNIAAHEIPSISRADAIEILEFVSALLRFVYELPGKMSRHKK